MIFFIVPLILNRVMPSNNANRQRNSEIAIASLMHAAARKLCLSQPPPDVMAVEHTVTGSRRPAFILIWYALKTHRRAPSK